MDNLVEYLLILGLILLNAFFAASEIAIVTMRKTRVRQLADEGRGAARAILRLTENNSRFLATIQIGVTLTSFFASAFGAVSLTRILEDWLKTLQVDFIRSASSTFAFILVTILIAFLSLVFGELVPKTLALEAAEGIAMAVARPIELLAKFTSPIVFVLTSVTNFFVRLLGGQRKATMSTVSEEEIVSMVETGQEEGVIQKQKSDILNRVFEFGDRQVREIMVPRVDVTMLEASQTVSEAASEVVASGYSRYPVYTGGNREQIIGVAFAKDILKYLCENRLNEPIENVVRPALFVPESKRVDDLLAELQKSRSQITLVMDEYGGLAGLVTLEDCLEEIVGEIQDEFDAEESRIKLLENGEFLVDGATSLNEINAHLDLHFEGEEVDTIGGLILKRLGRIAVAGDSITETETRQIENPADPNSDVFITQITTANIRVEKMEGLRIRQVRFKIETGPEDKTKSE